MPATMLSVLLQNHADSAAQPLESTGDAIARTMLHIARNATGCWVCSCCATFLIPDQTMAQQLILPEAPLGVETFTQQGIQFSRVRARNIEALVPPNGNLNRPIGGGSWDFGISRTELTQAQWIEFINAFNEVPVPDGHSWSSDLISMLRGDFWAGPGLYGTVVGPQGRFVNAVTELGAVLPVRGIGWYGAALYCNWLQNDRHVSLDAINNGVYDLRQWSGAEPTSWPLVARQDGARYWIPRYDEWAVASFYDEGRFGPGQEGWWPYQNRRTRAPVPGPPGMGETAAGWDPPGGPVEALILPVASYPDSQSPWGLLDTSGTYAELLDDQDPFGFGRLFAGTQSGPFTFPDLDVYFEQLGWVGSESPTAGGSLAFRIATSTVPAPFGAVSLLLAMPLIRRRRR